MPKQPSMDDLMTALLTGKAVAAQQQPDATPGPLPAPEADQGPARSRPEVWRTLRTPDGLRLSLRQQQRDARLYAEAWYQALREPVTHTRSDLVTGDGPRRSSGRQMVPVVGNWVGSPASSVTYTQIDTPMGRVSRSAVARLCNADSMLSEVWRGAGLATLIHASGRGWAGRQARRYGHAALRLAAALGDPRGGELQHLVLAEDSATISVKLPQ